MQTKGTGDYVGVKYASVSNFDQSTNRLWFYEGGNGAFFKGQPYQVDNGVFVQNAFVIRPALILDMKKIAFAIDADATAGALVNVENEGPEVLLKLRIYDNSINRIQVTDQNKVFAKGATIKVPYSNAEPDKHLSVLYFDENQEFKYYRDFGNQPSSGFLEIPTDDISLGNYTLKLVNEAYTNDKQPSAVSEFSEGFKIQLVDPHAISYSKNPNSGASNDKDYEYYDIGTGSCSQIVEDYFSVEYNNIKGGDERVTDFFESGLVN